MRVVVVGAGAMGSIFAAALLRGGCEVAFVERRPEVVARLRAEGLRLEGVTGPFTAPVEAFSPEEPAGAPAGIVMVQVDSNATAEAARIAGRHLAPDGFVITVQNGIGNVEALQAALGREHVLAGSTYNSGASTPEGLPLHTNLGETVLGEVDGAGSERSRALAALLTAGGLPTRDVTNVMGFVWSKFVHNCAINALSAITGLRPGEIARNRDAATLLDAILAECLAVVEASGIVLPEAHPRQEIRDHCWVRYNRPSMLQHLDSGRPTEIDALNGALVRRAAELGVPAPVNATIALLVKAVEARHRLRSAGPVDEPALEAAARLAPRGDAWGADRAE